ncbi:MAG: hypothetical protein M1834_008300 [Cirrosporium novae-zelandiae]|nr:MAG: hypothetical protein M1834_008300 [Cirrosporium novae-zelandiae]
MDQEILERLRSYASDSRSSTSDAGIGGTVSETARSNYESQINTTLRQLQDQVSEQENALQKLRSSTTGLEAFKPSSDSNMRLRQVRLVKEAYDSMLSTETDLPNPDSALPVLLELRQTYNDIIECTASIKCDHPDLEHTRNQLNEEEADLRDNRQINEALKARIARLQIARQNKSQKSSNQLGKELLREQQKKKKKFLQDTERLSSSLGEFIDQHLAAMLAAEELGGPTVGNMLNISDEVLKAGFTNQGKPKRQLGGSQSKQDKTQKRIDEIWAPEGQGEDRDETRTAREAAATEMKSLLLKLLDASHEGTGTTSYINLDRDSAASRFLVRSKVAYLHQKDARKLRLIDFSREIDG